MKKIQDISALFFIVSVVVLSVVASLGIWDFLSRDVLSKTFETIGILAIATLIISVASSMADNKVGMANTSQINIPNPLFSAIRHSTIAVLIVLVVFLTLFGVMAIWDMIGGQVVDKSLSTMGLLTFSAVVINITCMQREGMTDLKQKKISTGMTIFAIILAMWVIPMIFSLIW